MPLVYIFHVTVRSREVFFSVGTSEQVSASAYGRYTFIGGFRYRVFLKKWPGPQAGVCLREVPASGGSTVFLELFTIVEKRGEDQNRD